MIFHTFLSLEMSFLSQKYQYLIYGYICIMDLGCEKRKLVEIPFLFWIELLVSGFVYFIRL